MEHTDLKGFDVGVMYEVAGGPKQCHAFCNELSKCNFFLYKATNHECWLKGLPDDANVTSLLTNGTDMIFGGLNCSI